MLSLSLSLYFSLIRCQSKRYCLAEPKVGLYSPQSRFPFCFVFPDLLPCEFFFSFLSKSFFNIYKHETVYTCVFFLLDRDYIHRRKQWVAIRSKYLSNYSYFQSRYFQFAASGKVRVYTKRNENRKILLLFFSFHLMYFFFFLIEFRLFFSFT